MIGTQNGHILSNERTLAVHIKVERKETGTKCARDICSNKQMLKIKFHIQTSNTNIFFFNLCIKQKFPPPNSGM